MKKLFAVMLAAVLLALSLVSCGNKSFSYMDEDLSAYVTAGEYKNLTVTIPAAAEITDEDVKGHAVEHIGHSDEEYETLTEGVAALDDIVSIDFVGVMDGEEFEGGSAEDTALLLGSGSMIDGFEDGIVGMAVGESKTIDVTFPEEYENNPDLAGKPAQFTITLNSIYADSLLDAVREELEASREDTIEANKNKYAWTAVVNNATVSAYPEGSVKKLAEELYNYYEAMYYSYGITPENLGITEESCEDEARAKFKEELVLYSLVKANGYTITEEEYNTKVEALAAEQAITVADYESYYSRQSVETKIYYEKVMADVLATATFVEE